MAKRFLQPPRKRRTRNHVLADLSVNHVERVALQCGYAVERVRQDYGIDLAVYTFDENGFRHSGVVWMQLKATDRPKVSQDGMAFLVRLDRRDVLSWIAEAYPVILVVYDGSQDRACWLDIHSYFVAPGGFSKLHGKTITVSVPTANLLNDKCMYGFARAKADIMARQGEQR